MMRFTALALTLVLLISAIPPVAMTSEATVNQELERLLGTEDLTIEGTEILAEQIILDIYQGNDFNPFWTRESDIRELLDLIEEAPDHGLIPADYNHEQLLAILSRRSGNPTAATDAESEILLTESLLRYGYHRRLGKIKASSMDPDINFRRDAFRNQPPTETLREILEAPSLQNFIDLAAPSGPYYKKIQYWLDRYMDMAANGGWPQVPDGPTLRLGDSDPRVAAIRARLAVTGDLPSGFTGRSNEFDRELKEAVAFFQARHALDDDGIVGRMTLAAMNVPIEHRIDQLRASLERLRWVNQEAAETLVVVNIAGFRASFFKDGVRAWTTRAMVGKTYRQTPVFRGDIAYMEFNPTWTIPPGILRNDTLPAIKRDPNYLASKNIRVIDRNGQFVDPATVDWNQYSRGVPYTLRQEPGPINALGTVKFIFPNEHFVFLHDTPHRELFDQPERAFSSGCIRIEDPLRLAELLLDDSDKYPRSKLQAIVDSRQTQRINLSPKIPVVILYATASIDANGNPVFLKDIYGRDQRVLDALDGEVVIDLPPMENP
jgi:murein L,D-transpeptidase YcbB/YkuD